MRQSWDSIRRYWFLETLLVLVVVGMWWGMSGDLESLQQLTSRIKPRLITTIVLFLMAFGLDSSHLVASFRNPLPVALAAVLNLGLIPLLALATLELQTTPDFRFGVMIAASVPCTLAAASVWTRKAGGNDAVSLLVTLLTNGICFAVTPLWLRLGTGSGVELPFAETVIGLLKSVLLPTLAGQIVRQVSAMRDVAIRYKVPIGVVAQVCILSLAFTAAGNAGQQLREGSANMPAEGAVIACGTCIALHLTAMAAAFWLCKCLRISRVNTIPVVFAGSQKTLPIGVLLATDPTMFGNPDLLGPGVGIPFAVFPIIMFHASQLFIDTIVADRFRKWRDEEKTEI